VATADNFHAGVIGNQPKCHETVRRAVAVCKGGWDNQRRDLATVPESLPCAARLNDERSTAGRLCPGANRGSGAVSSANVIGVTVSLAAASSSAGRIIRIDRRRIRVGTASSISLSRLNRGLGQ
jgi:hypothetical protein